MRQTANLPHHPRRRSPLKFFILCRVREVVFYFKFHKNRLRVLGAVRDRKSPSLIGLAHGLHNSLYTTVQAVTTHTLCVFSKFIHLQPLWHYRDVIILFVFTAFFSNPVAGQLDLNALLRYGVLTIALNPRIVVC